MTNGSKRFTWLQMKILVRAGQTRRAAHLELHARESQNIAEESALRPVAFARINDNSEKQHEDVQTTAK